MVKIADDPTTKFKSLIGGALSLVSVCINIALIVALSNFKQDEINTIRTTRRFQDMKSFLCAGCHVFGTSRDHVSTNRNITTLSLQDQSLCCVEEAESLITLINIMMMRTYSIRTVPGVQPVTSAHLYLDTLTDNDYSWTDEYGYGAGHVTKNLEFRNGRVFVKRSGIYNIYSFITFKQRDESASPTSVVHSFRKLNPLSNNHRPVDLLKGTRELSAVGQSFITSYLGGIVRLEASDEVYVDTSHLNLIYRFAPANFIGLHLLEEV